MRVVNLNSKFNGLKNQAEKRGILFTLERSRFIEWWKDSSEECYYCGISAVKYKKLLTWLLGCSKRNPEVDAYKWLIYARFTGARKLIKNLTIDRVDSFKGYEVGNVVKACWICNHLKGRYIDGELYRKIAKSTMRKIWNAAKEEYKLQGEHFVVWEEDVV